jgi:GT2 family glycosyltransferase
MEPKVVIITLNYNQNDYTITCVESILKSDYPNFQLLLVENGSTEENQQEIVKRLPDDERILFRQLNPNRGYVGGVNYGLEEGSKLDADYFLIMNNDTIIDPTAISELVKTSIKHNDHCIVSGKVYHYDDPKRLQYIGSRLKNPRKLEFERIASNDIDEGQYDQEVERDLLDDIFWLVPKRLYDEIGGYSKYFWFNGESADYALNAKEKNYKLIYAPSARLWHKGSISIGGRNSNPRLVYWHIQSILILKYLHLKRGDFIGYYFHVFRLIVEGYLKSFVKMLIGRENQFKRTTAMLHGFLYFNNWLIVRSENTGKSPY